MLDSRYGLDHDFDVYDELYRHLDEQLEFEIQQARAEDVVKAALAVVSRRSRASRGSSGCTSTTRTRPTSRRRRTRIAFPDDFYSAKSSYTDASLAPLLETVRSIKPVARSSS